jgi:DMSO reductase anchor subunit
MKTLIVLLGCFCLIVGIGLIPIRLALGKPIDALDALITVSAASIGLFDIIDGVADKP